MTAVMVGILRVERCSACWSVRSLWLGGVAGQYGQFQTTKNPAGARSERQGEIRYSWKAYTAGLKR